MLVGVNCDSTQGSTLENRICANLELQRRDSLLQADLDMLIAKYRALGDTVVVKKIRRSRDIWEKFRFSECDIYVEEANAHQMIEFMQCAALLTHKRRMELAKYLED